MDTDDDLLEKTPVGRKLQTNDPMSFGKLDRSPPDLWTNRNTIVTNSTPLNSSPPSWTKGLTQDDLNSMHQLGCLSINGIASEVRKLYDKAFQIGVLEAKEMSRGRSLGALSNNKKK